MFDVYKTLDLSYLGDNWQNCYLKFTYLTAQEAKDFSTIQIDQNDIQQVQETFDKTLNLLKNKFVEGKAMSSGQQIEIHKEDLDDFPIDVLTRAVQFLVGAPTEAEKK